MGAPFLKSEWLVPMGLARWQRILIKELRRRAPRTKDVVWFFSSGTTGAGRVKALGLSFSALEISAASVNAHLQATPQDRWSVEIPLYHIGGYSIPLRAKLSRSKVIYGGAWSVKDFIRRVKVSRVTLTSLVPTQVFDLVEANVQAPPSLRAVVVGGGSLDPHLYARARALKWPLLPSYGLTECASQVATAPLSSLSQREFPGLLPLSHVQVEIQLQRLSIRSLSMSRWTLIAHENGLSTCELTAPKGRLQTEDLAEWKGARIPGRPDLLNILGRQDDVVKVYGVLVSLAQVESDLREVCRQLGIKVFGDFTLFARPAEREGSHLIVAVAGDLAPWPGLIKKYNAGVTGPFRIRETMQVKEIPRTALGKVRRSFFLNNAT